MYDSNFVILHHIIAFIHGLIIQTLLYQSKLPYHIVITYLWNGLFIYNIQWIIECTFVSWAGMILESCARVKSRENIYLLLVIIVHQTWESINTQYTEIIQKWYSIQLGHTHDTNFHVPVYYTYMIYPVPTSVFILVKTRH